MRSRKAMSSEGPALIALGGNALILPGERGYIEQQFDHTDTCMRPIAELIKKGMHAVITHGNGPVVGNILLRNECAKDYIPPMPLYICVADSQGGIGAMMAQSLGNGLRTLGIERSVTAVVTHVVVDGDDPAFREPTKPIGPYYSDDKAKAYMDRGWTMQRIPERGWRRLVASPRPQRIVEIDVVKRLLEKKEVVPIACGGGGIPVTEEKGVCKGVNAVIDKDLSATLLARSLLIERLIIVTDVKGVYLNWNSDHRKKIDTLTSDQAKTYLMEGQFPPGSMGPKIEAAVEFIEGGGKEVIIAQPEELLGAVLGEAGTRIVC